MQTITYIHDRTHFQGTGNTNFLVLGLTRSGLEPTIFRTRDEHANHYAAEAMLLIDVTT
jgi:hypothetical protein